MEYKILVWTKDGTCIERGKLTSGSSILHNEFNRTINFITEHGITHFNEDNTGFHYPFHMIEKITITKDEN